MFYRFLTLFFKIFVYRGYYKKYKLPKGFRFNGFLIRINGNGRMEVGANTYISFYSYINLQAETELVIGNDVSIGHNVKIYTSTLDTSTFILEGVKKQKKSSVNIGNNVLIGANVFICPGVTIGDNVLIGANSVVSKSIPSNSVAAGCPAVVIKNYKA
ncbi:acyltransferase [Pseudoalteromonas sp. A757]|uniref:acyltransferase n=1 Tax=Pseudoalteromonas sp. A757 TaxID=2250709 RepID=UPI000FFED320|nr:acyltransferase [Pseudoalteromonas sp. A757]RXE84503.1 acyltransferase [Pseudoalteromonas sp. A757]